MQWWCKSLSNSTFLYFKTTIYSLKQGKCLIYSIPTAGEPVSLLFQKLLNSFIQHIFFEFLQGSSQYSKCQRYLSVGRSHQKYMITNWPSSWTWAIGEIGDTPPPTLFLECAFCLPYPLSEPASRIPPQNRNVVLRLSGLGTDWSHLRILYKLLR